MNYRKIDGLGSLSFAQFFLFRKGVQFEGVEIDFILRSEADRKFFPMR
jgi:hypothetical protein